MSKKYVLMHSLVVPTKRDILVKNIDEVRIFLENKLETIEKKNINKKQIIFDFGLGFGKDGYQSFALMNLIDTYHKYGVKILVGHSRKSMLKTLENDIKTPDIETTALSLKLANKVDIFRVHTPIEHQNALLAYKSV
jgi:2-amino-4-hydroxy-6-hydroxymethyldihydropteridine diphosphokinase/dihydropteroate synthase